MMKTRQRQGHGGVAQEANGRAQTLTSRFQSPLTTASSHYPQHQFTALRVDGIYKDYFLIPFCCLELDALLCKQLTHADILCATLGRKQVFW